MAVDTNDYNDNYSSLHHMRRDVRDAHVDSKMAKLLSYLALAGTILSLVLAIWALDKAGEAQMTANRAQESAQRVQ